MATTTDPTEEPTLRPGSYILVSAAHASHNDDGDASQQPLYARRRKPRCAVLLPLLALIDGGVTASLGAVVYRQEGLHQIQTPRSQSVSGPRHTASRERSKVVLIVITFSLVRVCAYAIIGFCKKIRQQGVTVAAISILSMLFYLSIANMLFQARTKHSLYDPDQLTAEDHDKWHWMDAFRHVHPTMTILLGIEIAFTLLEWIVYIAVVGVKIPPGSNPVRAKRWARSLAKNPIYQRGAESQSLHDSDPEDVEQTDDSHGDSTDHQDATSPLRTRSPARSTRSGSSPAAAGSLRPHGYGSMLDEPRTPPSNHHFRANDNQSSVRSNKRVMQAPQIGSRQSELYARSPDSAELGREDCSAANDADDSMTSDDIDPEDNEDEASDPDEIVDVTPNRKVARQEARMRLAHAALPERRLSGGTLAALNLFGAGVSHSTPTRSPQQDRSTAFSDSPAEHDCLTELNAHLPKSTSSGAFSAASIVHSSSSDSVFPSSSGAGTPSSSRSSFKDKRLRLPKWMKPKRKSSNRP